MLKNKKTTKYRYINIQKFLSKNKYINLNNGNSKKRHKFAVAKLSK